MGETIAELAERLLFGDRLEDKLRPRELGAGDEGAERGATSLPATSTWLPGRPRELRLDGPRQKVRFPTLGAGSDERAHGAALHFFANHELLAIELMALFLLRFPEAPGALRRAVVHTISEEQDHLGRYLTRMAELGVRFGSLPVSGFFWDCLRGMESPQQYLATLALTFEQANLDHSRRFGAEFARAGDAETAALMQRIHDDEVGHVRLGASWLERLAEPGDERPLWERYREALPAPLTPAWAKGAQLDREGRRAAGLDDDFIDALEAYTRSRGRPPRVYLFNPLVEAAFDRAPKPYRPTGPMQRFVEDLSLLPAFLAGRDDLVLLAKPPRAEHVRGLRELGFELPQLWSGPVESLVDADESESFAHIGGLRPWAWSPDSAEVLAPLREYDLEPPRVEPDAELYSKTWACELAQRWLAAHGEDWIAPVEAAGAVCREPGEVEALVRAELAAGGALVVKTPWSTAGRGAVRYREPDDWAKRSHWLHGRLRTQGAVVAQPWQRRVLDLSALFSVGSDGTVRVEGVTRFLTDERGQYLGTVLGSPLDGVEAALVRFVAGDGGGKWRVFEHLEAVARHVGAALAARGHRGPAGVDALIYEERAGGRGEGAGRFRLHPLIEVNPRHTMGHVALALGRHVARRRSGSFRIVTRRTLRSEGFPDFATWLAARPAARLDRRGRLAEGVVALTDPETASDAMALLEVNTRQGGPGT